MENIFENLIVKVVYTNTGYNYKWNQTTNNYKVIIKNKDTKKYTMFKYYTGTGIKINEISCIDVLYCILSDCMAVLDSNDYYDFCDIFGYDYNKNSSNIYKECKNSIKKMTRILNGVDIKDFYNRFMDKNHDNI